MPLLMKGLTVVGIVAMLLAWLFLASPAQWILACFLFLAVLWLWYLHNPDGSQRSQGLAAALSAAALMFGVYWYLIERPGAAKLDLELETRAYKAAGGRALILLSVEVENVGNTPVSFEGDEDAGKDGESAGGPEKAPPPPPADVDCLPQERAPAMAAGPGDVMTIRLGKALPLTAGLKQRLACATWSSADGGQVALARADLWPPVAWAAQSLVTRIEAGESEKYYYRVLVRCEKGLVLVADARIPKSGTITDALVRKEPVGLVWIGQTTVDVSAVCGK